jgi:hypothetical protein
VTLPRWVRALQTIDRAAYYGYRLHEIVRDELLFGFLDPRVWPEVTDTAYAALDTYLPGGSRFESGLFGWEEQALEHPAFPKRGRLLLGAAGGGRELRELSARGYEVVAFEPNERLLAGARAVGDSCGAIVHQASYADLVRSQSGEGPLASLRRAPPFDAIVLGWGSITHLLDPAEQDALFATLRKSWPRAPVLASFYTRVDPTPPSRSATLRRRLRDGLRHVGGRARPGDQLTYVYAGGFAYCFSEIEIEGLAARAGYDVAAFAVEPFGHALLVPRD